MIDGGTRILKGGTVVGHDAIGVGDVAVAGGGLPPSAI